MTQKQASALFRRCAIAVFGAEMCGQELRVHVYPLKRGGFAWLLRVGRMNFDDIDACIKDGGTFPSTANVDAVVKYAVSIMLARSIAITAGDQK